jgi:hypothetical protein
MTMAKVFTQQPEPATTPATAELLDDQLAQVAGGFVTRFPVPQGDKVYVMYCGDSGQCGPIFDPAKP